jgi:hypothetical protein
LHTIVLNLDARRNMMTNKNDNRERKNKYPNNANNDTEFAKEPNIRSEITKNDLKKKK